MLYGQQPHDFDEGVLYFMAPGQVITVTINKHQEHNPSGWMILFYPDLLLEYCACKNYQAHEYFVAMPPMKPSPFA